MANVTFSRRKSFNVSNIRDEKSHENSCLPFISSSSFENENDVRKTAIMRTIITEDYVDADDYDDSVNDDDEGENSFDDENGVCWKSLTDQTTSRAFDVFRFEASRITEWSSRSIQYLNSRLFVSNDITIIALPINLLKSIAGKRSCFDPEQPNLKSNHLGIQQRKQQQQQQPLSSSRPSFAFCVLVLSVALLIRHFCFMPLPDYQSRQEMDFRPFRFPTVEERVKYYMDDWYAPPCQENHKVHFTYHQPNSNTDDNTAAAAANYFFEVTELPADDNPSTTTTTTFQLNDHPTVAMQPRTLHIGPDVQVSVMFHFDRTTLSMCSHKTWIWSLGAYCSDALSTLQASMKDIDFDERIPLLLQFGDEDDSRAYSVTLPPSPAVNLDGGNSGEPKDALATTDFVNDEITLQHHVRLPHIKKFRRVVPQTEVERQTSQECNPGHWQRRLHPIIWKLNSKRHFTLLYRVPRYDRSWDSKINQAIFRGALTGTANDHQIDTAASDLENCMNLPRCRLAYMNSFSPLVDAKLTSTMGLLPSTIDGIPLEGWTCTMRYMMRYKGIILLEGNDVSSGLKWALLSNSVVLMPPPTYTSWAMEELLEPWIHYIPLNEDLTDVEEKVQWMIQHDAEAKRIAHRASLWIKDLVFHPQAKVDEEEINREILRRYEAYFQHQQTQTQELPISSFSNAIDSSAPQVNSIISTD